MVMSKPTDTKKPTLPTNSHQGCIDALESSPLFYFSAGSKELFHSDFLYWLAKRHWNVFIRVMRNLADLEDDESFWWEDSELNIQVKREQNHFDLSIYYRFEADKWVPVLVLENKVKSLPNAKQLLEYSKTAESKWDGKENNGKDLITFISLSLTDAVTQRNDPMLNLWTFKKYSDLADALENSLSNLSGFHKKLCEEYCQFIRALNGLADNWISHEGDLYLARLCPFALCAKDKLEYNKEYQEFKDLVAVRLDDIWQKVSFDNLRILIKNELLKVGIACEHFGRNRHGEKAGFYLDTGYASKGHRGLVELRYVLERHPFILEPVCVMIQIEGNQYRYVVATDGIMPENNNGSPNWNCLNGKVKRGTEQRIENWASHTPMSGKNDWCRFGSAFIYRYRQIKSSETIKDLIENIVKDALNIQKLFGRS